MAIPAINMNADCIKWMKRTGITLIFSLSMITKCPAQLELSNSIEFGCPELINSNNTKVLYSQITAGLRFGLSYKPTGTQFFPTLNYSFGFTRLPIQQFEQNVAICNFNYSDLMLYGNFVFPLLDNNSLYLMGGIGLSHLSHKGLGVSGPNNGSMHTQLDSVKNVTATFPAIGLGFEYVYGDAVNKNIYISMGFMLLYTYLYPERNLYIGSVTDNNNNVIPFRSYLSGQIVTPSVNMTLHVLLGKNVIFWKKKNSMYL